MATGMITEQQDHLEKQIKKQMGCMAGFLHLFDRHQILTGKRGHCPAKRRHDPQGFDSVSESEKSPPDSPETSTEFTKQKHLHPPATELRSPVAANLPPKSHILPFPVFDGANMSSPKLHKETPRLSLDSRATTDSKGGLHPKKEIRIGPTLSTTEESQQQCNRSPSVVARLMGLEPILDANSNSPDKKPELRRSASESRVSRDLFRSRLIVAEEKKNVSSDNKDLKRDRERSNGSSSINGLPRRKSKSFFDSGDVFPEPRQGVVAVENKLRMRGVDEASSKDLETLKQILEALQLKGLLHSRKQFDRDRISSRNFVYDEESPVVAMKHTIVSSSERRKGNDYSPMASPHRSPLRMGRSPSPTTRVEGNAGSRRGNSLVKPKPLNVETKRRMSGSNENRKVSPVHSPKKLSPRRAGPDPMVGNRSPRSKKETDRRYQKEKIRTVVEDEASSVSGSSITTSTDTERSKAEWYKEGRHLLDRCDKLLHSIAEIATDAKPSPVSVLDSFYRDESRTPSPVTTKTNTDFKDCFGELEDEIWSPMASPMRSKYNETSSHDCDFAYVSDVLRASRYLPEDSDVFPLLEEQQFLKGKDTSKASRLQRKMTFDIIYEILDRNRRLPPWTNYKITRPSVDKVWLEFARIREREPTDGDLFGVLKKDLAGDAANGWDDSPVEMSETILDIERLIFKDLITETIHNLAELASRSMFSFRRKLVF